MTEMSATPSARCSGDIRTIPGQRTIVGVLCVDCTLTAEGLIWLVASAGQMSDAPLVQDVVNFAHQHRMRLASPDSTQVVSGGGLRAVVDGRDVLLGTRSELQRDAAVLDPVKAQVKLLEAAGFSVLYAAVDSVPAGVIVVGDERHGGTYLSSGSS